MSGAAWEKRIIMAGMEDAEQRRHAFLLPEHFLAAVLAETGVDEALIERGIAPASLRKALEAFFAPLPTDSHPTPPNTGGMAFVLMAMKRKCQERSRLEPTPGDLLDALRGYGSCAALLDGAKNLGPAGPA
jgi:ATP-dependent Clp protease ATP-binding subunit ClpA